MVYTKLGPCGTLRLSVITAILLVLQAAEYIEVAPTSASTNFELETSDRRSPSKAIDGFNSTFFNSAPTTDNIWLKVTLEEPSFIKKVVILNRYTLH